MQQSVFLLLGSNRGDREQNLIQACAAIKKRIGNITGISSIYETEPWGFDDNTAFYNQALEVETMLSESELLNVIHGIEKDLGRVRASASCGTECGCSNEAYSSRTIDIDILFYASKILFTGELMIPHPRLHERRFTLIPLHEIAPDFIHPIFRESVTKLLNHCTDKGVVNRIDR